MTAVMLAELATLAMVLIAVAAAKPCAALSGF
jgi:hypothetical protein